MAASAAPGGIKIAYLFSTETGDVDPTDGYLRLGSSTQNAATVVRADLEDVLGVDQTAVLGLFDDPTITPKGYLRLQAASDASRWLLYSVTSVASPTGYRNIAVTPIASSATNPLLNGEGVILTFQPNGNTPTTQVLFNIQVATLTATQTVSSSGSYVDVTNLSVTLTPAAATSKVLLLAAVPVGVSPSGFSAFLQFTRGGTVIGVGDAASNRVRAGAVLVNDNSSNMFDTVHMSWLDSPASTSAQTYKVQIRGTSIFVNRSVSDSDTSANARTAATLIALEIPQ